MKLLLGTGNPTKSVHYRQYFADMPIELITAADLGITEEPEETGKTLEENAILKAKYYFEKSGGMPTLADDAGFEIPALDNFPGVQSRRFAGHDMTDDEIISGILEAMKALKGDERKARMGICCALMLAPDRIYTARATTEGYVPEVPSAKRETHFPYRSLLFVDSVNSWLGDIGPENKAVMDHRGEALEQLKQYLK